MKTRGRSCEGKVPLTRADAYAALQTMRKRSERRHTGNRNHSLKAYECIYCAAPRNWHVGHNAPPKQKNYKRVKPIRNYRIVESED